MHFKDEGLGSYTLLWLILVEKGSSETRFTPIKDMRFLALCAEVLKRLNFVHTSANNAQLFCILKTRVYLLLAILSSTDQRKTITTSVLIHCYQPISSLILKCLMNAF